ncbi:MAG: hypothetical protein PVJ51_09300, partial [Acidobacteriota bacterium]
SDAITDLKAQARILHRSALRNDAAAMSRLRAFDGWDGASDDEILERLQRKHCLLVVAREHGFTSWAHAATVLSTATPDDFGTLLYPSGTAAHWNIWSASYEEARRIREEHGGFLLAYRNQYLIVDEHFIRTLGLDPDDADWAAIGRDWARPKQPEARQRLYAKLIRQRRITASHYAPPAGRSGGRLARERGAFEKR